MAICFVYAHLRASTDYNGRPGDFEVIVRTRKRIFHRHGTTLDRAIAKMSRALNRMHIDDFFPESVIEDVSTRPAGTVPANLYVYARPWAYNFD